MWTLGVHITDVIHTQSLHYVLYSTTILSDTLRAGPLTSALSYSSFGNIGQMTDPHSY